MLELLIHQPLFIGFKADSTLRQHLESLNEADKKYVSADDSTYLRTCRVGEDIYIGKLIDETLTTDRVEDIRRNVLSILRKLGPLVRLPGTLKIFACNAAETESLQRTSVLDAPQADAAEPVTRPAIR